MYVRINRAYSKDQPCVDILTARALQPIGYALRAYLTRESLRSLESTNLCSVCKTRPIGVPSSCLCVFPHGASSKWNNGSAFPKSSSSHMTCLKHCISANSSQDLLSQNQSLTIIFKIGYTF